MSGHSKWANIKHRKGKMDALRGRLTTKIGREITVAVKMGGADPTGNMRLKLALQKARENNIPKDNIQRAIQKGQGGADNAHYEEFTYEGYGPGGAAITLEVLTDNRNRTAADVRHLFSKYGGNLGETGCVSWMFHQKAVFLINTEVAAEDDLLLLVLDAGAEDMQTEEEHFVIVGEADKYAQIDSALEEAQIEVVSGELRWIPDTTIALGETDSEKMLKLLDALEEHDDIQNVSTNAELPEEYDC